MTRIPGTPFTDDAPIPGTKSERIQQLEERIRQLEFDLNKSDKRVRQLESQLELYRNDAKERRERMYGEDT